MILDIYKDDKLLGTLSFLGNVPTFEPDFDDELARFIKESLDRGITRFVDIAHGDAHTIVEEAVPPDDPNLPLALKEWLQRNDYNTRERHPETDQAIKELLNLIPDGYDKHKVKQRIPQELDKMSHLEKTLILEELKKRINELKNSI